MKLKVYTTDGSSCTEKDFAIAEFSDDKGLKALKQVLLAFMANKRQGTHSTKTSSTVHGSGKKPFRQKGTGMARQGAKTRVQHYHGAVSHGPQPRDYTQKISKKMKQLALRRALFDRAAAGEVDVIERFEVADAKTKIFNGIINNIDAQAKKILVVDDSWSDTTILAARNIARVFISDAKDVNALDLSKYSKIIVSEKGLECVLNRANGGN
jgi:large subunit ribosomal protein L4